MVKPQIDVKWEFSAWNAIMIACHAILSFAVGGYLLANVQRDIADASDLAQSNRTEIASNFNLARGTELRQSITETKLESIDKSVTRIERIVEKLADDNHTQVPRRP